MIRSLYQNALTMYIRPIESELSYKLGAPVKLDVTSAIDVDHQQELTNIQNLAKAGLMTPRQAFGLMLAHDIMPGLDVQPEDLTELKQKNQAKPQSATKEGGEIENDSQDNQP